MPEMHLGGTSSDCFLQSSKRGLPPPTPCPPPPPTHQHTPPWDHIINPSEDAKAGFFESVVYVDIATHPKIVSSAVRSVRSIERTCEVGTDKVGQDAESRWFDPTFGIGLAAIMSLKGTGPGIFCSQACLQVQTLHGNHKEGGARRLEMAASSSYTSGADRQLKKVPRKVHGFIFI